MSQGDRADAGDDRLIFLADALKLVPFSETTLRRAITKGELEAWQPNTDGKIVVWRSTLIAWATRRPAPSSQEQPRHERRSAKPSARQPRRTASTALLPEPIPFPEVR
jgi:hypothetical protein